MKRTKTGWFVLQSETPGMHVDIRHHQHHG
jgi:hypothetical protein